jgi:hypothetical protein
MPVYIPAVLYKNNFSIDRTTLFPVVYSHKRSSLQPLTSFNIGAVYPSTKAPH